MHSQLNTLTHTYTLSFTHKSLARDRKITDFLCTIYIVGAIIWQQRIWLLKIQLLLSYQIHYDCIAFCIQYNHLIIIYCYALKRFHFAIRFSISFHIFRILCILLKLWSNLFVHIRLIKLNCLFRSLSTFLVENQLALDERCVHVEK